MTLVSALSIFLGSIDHLPSEIRDYYSETKDGSFRLRVRKFDLKYPCKSSKAGRAATIHTFKGQPIDYVLGEMKAMYLDGKTLQDIGVAYGVSRERVRQILSANDISSKEGGRTVRAKKVKENKLSKLNERFMRRLGVGVDEYRRINKEFAVGKKTPGSIFISQRNNAKKREIPWEFMFVDWWAVWEGSEKWFDRGRGHDRYVMARHGDTGPYSTTNVSIALADKNNSDGGKKSAMARRRRGAGIMDIHKNTEQQMETH